LRCSFVAEKEVTTMGKVALIVSTLFCTAIACDGDNDKGKAEENRSKTTVPATGANSPQGSPMPGQNAGDASSTKSGTPPSGSTPPSGTSPPSGSTPPSSGTTPPSGTSPSGNTSPTTPPSDTKSGTAARSDDARKPGGSPPAR
jgi:hypothetical protein